MLFDVTLKWQSEAVFLSTDVVNGAITSPVRRSVSAADSGRVAFPWD
jgi:hypothetical protein